MDTEEDNKTTEPTEELGTTTEADADVDGEGDDKDHGDGEGEGGLQVAELPDVNLEGVMEEAERISKEEDDIDAAKAEKRRRLKQDRNKRFGLEQEIVELSIEEEVEEEETSEAMPDTEAEPQYKPQPVSEPEVILDKYAQDQLEAEKLLEVVSDISIVSVASYDDNAVQRKSAFLKIFEVPSFSDISSEQSLVHYGASPKDQARSPRVSKRSGSKKRSKLSTDGREGAATADSTDKEGEQSGSEESSSGLIEIDSADLALDFFKAKEVPTVGFGTGAIEIFDMILDTGDKVQEVRISEMFRRRQKEEIGYLVDEFVEQLLTDTVYKYETELAEMLKRNRFDKKKLYQDLQNSVDACLLEQQKNIYLNGKMVEYNRRNKNFRAFDKLSPKAARTEHERYMCALYQLDFAKQKAALAKKQKAYFMASVIMDLVHVQNLSMDIEEHLELVFSDAFSSKSEGFRRFVERELRRMQQVRYEISDVRLALITRKHTLGVIREKIGILEHINDDIHMNDFINLQNQVASLYKKIEEKNNELKKARHNHTTDVHLAQHNREKVQSLTNQRREAEYQLTGIRNKQQGLRKQLYDAKIKKKHLRSRLNELKFKGGLLAMPNLMHDYDKTKQKVKEKQRITSELKEQVKRLTERISEYESRLLTF